VWRLDVPAGVSLSLGNSMLRETRRVLGIAVLASVSARRGVYESPQAFIDGGNGAYFANSGDDVHAVGTLALNRGRLHRLHRDPARRQPPTGPPGARPAGAAEAGLVRATAAQQATRN
jgi:hypothetical protein